MANTHYIDTDAYEAAVDALRGAHAVGVIIQDATTGEGAERWSNNVVDDLSTAQRYLIDAGIKQLERLRETAWRSNALLGNYGPEAQRRAELARAGEVARGDA